MKDYMHLQTVLNWSVLVDLLFVAIVGFCFTFMLFVGLGEGMILHRWFKFAQDKFLLKPFGGCMPCTGFWLTAAFSVWYGIHDPIQILFACAISITIMHKI